MIAHRIRSYFAFAPSARQGDAFAVPHRPEDAATAICPDEPLCLIGDLHGCADLLESVLEARARHFADHRLVVLGDMIDRGEESAKVLSLLRAEAQNGAVCLMGNHEALLLEALAQTGRNAASAAWCWLQNGGLATICSYGLHKLPRDPQEAAALLPDLIALMGQETLAWLGDLPVMWRSGNLVACHAGMDPALLPAAQPRQALLWGHPDFLRRPRRDGLHVAHGHVIASDVSHVKGRLSLDTGAYATGRLGFALADPRRSGAGGLRLCIADRGGCQF